MDRGGLFPYPWPGSYLHQPCPSQHATSNTPHGGSPALLAVTWPISVGERPGMSRSQDSYSDGLARLSRFLRIIQRVRQRAALRSRSADRHPQTVGIGCFSPFPPQTPEAIPVGKRPVLHKTLNPRRSARRDCAGGEGRHLGLFRCKRKTERNTPTESGNLAMMWCDRSDLTVSAVWSSVRPAVPMSSALSEMARCDILGLR